jgi:microcin C transport system substrate-binding protein
MEAVMRMKLIALALATLVAVSPALAQDKVWHHGGSLIGEPKYPEGFQKFDYVNPDAPVGGVVRLSDMGGFDTFNPILPKGEVRRAASAWCLRNADDPVA